jgi:hypothetical protein
MNHKLFFLILAFTWSLPSFSQSDSKLFDLKQGPEYEGKASFVNQVVGVLDDRVIIVRTQKKKLYIESLDQKGAVVMSVLLEGQKYKEVKKKFVSAFILKDKLYLRFGAYDKKHKMAYGLIDEYDSASLQFSKNVSTESNSVEGAKGVYWYGIGASRAFSELSESGFFVSAEKNYVVDYTSRFDKDKSANENITMRVYDANMDLAWEKEFEIPYGNELFHINHVIVDENGNTHLLGAEYPGKVKSSKKDAKFNVKYHVLSFMNKGMEIKDNSLDMEGFVITDVAIGITSDGYLVASGFYGNKNMFSIDGSFSIKMDIKTHKVLFSNRKEFGKEFIQMGMTDRELKKSNKKEEKGQDLELPEFDLDRFVLMPDGGWLLMAEQFYITTSTYTTSGPNGSVQTRTVTVYHYDDIILVKMNASGEIEWNTKITKTQYSSGMTSHLSYSWFYCEGKVYIIYNTAPERKEIQVTATIVDAKGETSTEKLMSGERDELLFHPLYSAKISDCKMFIYSSKRKTYQFGLLDVK